MSSVKFSARGRMNLVSSRARPDLVRYSVSASTFAGSYGCESLPPPRPFSSASLYPRFITSNRWSSARALDCRAVFFSSRPKPQRRRVFVPDDASRAPSDHEKSVVTSPPRLSRSSSSVIDPSPTASFPSWVPPDR